MGHAGRSLLNTGLYDASDDLQCPYFKIISTTVSIQRQKQTENT